MDYLLDTSTLSFALKGNEAVAKRLSAARTNSRMYTSAVCEGELMYGALRLGKERRLKLLDEIALTLSDLTGVLPITRNIAGKYGEIKRDLAARGQMIGLNDVWIGATAGVEGLTLVTSDRGFHRIDDLVLEDWLEP